MKLESFVYRWPLTFVLLCALTALLLVAGANPALVGVARQFLFCSGALFVVSLFGHRHHPPK